VQNLYGTFVLGVGFFLGGLYAGAVGDAFTTGSGDDAVENWTAIWLCAAAVAAVCVAGMLALFPRELPPADETSKDLPKRPSGG
jgi:hypothetical protein